MHDATVLGFSKRRAGVNIIGMAHYIPGGRVAMPAVATAARVTLHHGHEIVTVENIRPAGAAGVFIGVISRFERSLDAAYLGMRASDAIAFEEAHAFSVGD